MNPNNYEQVDLRLPSPEHADSQLSFRRETNNSASDKGVLRPVGPNPAVAQQTNSQSVNPTQPMQHQTSTNPQALQHTTKAQGIGLDAIEADDIEEHWVTAAKRTIERAGQDPKLLADELHKLKAEYLQKRFGKAFKLNEQ